MLPFNISTDCPEIFDCTSRGSIDASESDITTWCRNANATAIAMCVSDQITEL